MERGRGTPRGKKMECWKVYCGVPEGWRALVIRPESSHCSRCCWVCDVRQSWLHLGSSPLCTRDIIGTSAGHTYLCSLLGGADSPRSSVLPGVHWGSEEQLRSGDRYFLNLRNANHPARRASAALQVPSHQELPQGSMHMGPEVKHLWASASELSHCLSMDKSRAAFIHFLTWASLCHLHLSP